MTGTEGMGEPRPAPRLRGLLEIVLVVMLACGVIAMHSPGVEHLTGHGPGESIAAAGQDPADAHGVATGSHEMQTGLASAPPRATSPDPMGDHGGMAMCMAVLSLLVWVALRRHDRSFRTVRRLTQTARLAVADLMQDRPRSRAPSLSELCICRT